MRRYISFCIAMALYFADLPSQLRRTTVSGN